MHLVDITMFYAAEGGGVSTYLNAKARWLAQRASARHTVVSPNLPANCREPGLRHLPGLPVPGLHGFRWPRSTGSAARVLDALEPDLIEVGDASPCALASLRVARRRGIPAVAFYHSDLPQLIGERMGKLVERGARRYLGWLYRQFDLVLAPSRLMVQQLASMGVPHAVHQPLGIDLRVFHPGRRIETLREHLHLPADARLLVYAGRFTPEKKLGVLIEAVRKLGRPYHLLLVGGGDELPRYPQISYIPFRRDQRALARLLASCDLLVHPGDCETFGLIVLEAMACGIPVVGARGGGVAELVDDATGILVQPGCVDSLCAGIEAAYRDGLAERGRQARRRVQEQFDWDHVMPQLMRRYAGLLEARARAQREAQPFYVPE